MTSCIMVNREPYQCFRGKCSLRVQGIKIYNHVEQELGSLDSRELNLQKLSALATPQTSETRFEIIMATNMDVTVPSALNVNMDAAGYSEAFVPICHTTRCHIPGDRNLTGYFFLIL